MPPSKAIVSVRTLLVCLLLALAIAGLATFNILYARNTLEAHRDFLLGKLLQSPPVMGSFQARETRQLLAGNRLNLEVWHGAQEVIWGPLGEPTSATFRFRIGTEGFLCVGQRTRDGFDGFRLSREPELPSLAFQSRRWAFTAKQTLAPLKLDGQWQRAEVVWGAQGMQLFVDGNSVGKLSSPTPSRLGLAIRGGFATTSVDDLKVRGAQGEILVDEDFSNDRNLLRTASFCVVGLLGLNILVLGLAARRQKPSLPGRWALFQGGCLMALVLWFWFDYRVWSHRYHYPQTVPWGQREAATSPAERLRHLLSKALDPLDPRQPYRWGKFFWPEGTFDNWNKGPQYHLLTGEPTSHKMIPPDNLAEVLKNSKVPTQGRLLLLGSSQTYGEGAEILEWRLASSLQASLQKQSSTPITVLNASRRGGNAQELGQHLKALLSNFQPQVVVINLSNNDGAEPEKFPPRLSELVEHCQNAGAQVVLSLEANAPQQDQAIRELHESVREVAKTLRVPVADLHGHLLEEAGLDSGFLWWDTVHLTAHGQSLAGQFLAEAVAAAALSFLGGSRN